PLGKGELDGALRRAVLERLPRTSFLPPAAGAPDEDDDSGLPESLRPRDAEVVEGAGADTVRVLAEVLPTLLPAGLERRAEPGWWRRLYESLAGVDPERLSGLPVPLAGDPAGGFGSGAARTTIGPRQVLLPGDGAAGIEPGVLTRLGLKVAHPEAAHPLLEK